MNLRRLNPSATQGLPVCSLRAPAFLLVLLALSDVAAGGIVLSNSKLRVTIREDNGAIDAFEIPNTPIGFPLDFYNPSTQVSDFGIQNGLDESTGLLNTTDPGRLNIPELPVTVSPSGLVTGVFTGGGANVEMRRQYSLVGELSALLIETTFINNGDDVTLRYYDTYDPDQGILRAGTFSTFNDVFETDGITVAEAIAGAGPPYTAALGSDDPRAVLEAAGRGGNFRINPIRPPFIGSIVNKFFDSPSDGDGQRIDLGIHIGFEIFIPAGGSTSVRYAAAGSESPEEALADIRAALQMQATPVPEPASLALWAIGALGAAGLRFRRRFNDPTVAQDHRNVVEIVGEAHRR